MAATVGGPSPFLHMMLTIDGKTIVDEDLELKFWSFPSNGPPKNIVAGPDDAAYLTELLFILRLHPFRENAAPHLNLFAL